MMKNKNMTKKKMMKKKNQRRKKKLLSTKKIISLMKSLIQQPNQENALIMKIEINNKKLTVIHLVETMSKNNNQKTVTGIGKGEIGEEEEADTTIIIKEEETTTIMTIDTEMIEIKEDIIREITTDTVMIEIKEDIIGEITTKTIEVDTIMIVIIMIKTLITEETREIIKTNQLIETEVTATVMNKEINDIVNKNIGIEIVITIIKIIKNDKVKEIMIVLTTIGGNTIVKIIINLQVKVIAVLKEVMNQKKKDKNKESNL